MKLNLRAVLDAVVYRVRRLLELFDHRSVTYLPTNPFSAPGLDIHGYSVDDVLRIRQAWVNERAEARQERETRDRPPSASAPRYEAQFTHEDEGNDHDG